MDYKSWRRGDFTLHRGAQEREISYHLGEMEDWTITFADTGLATNTGGRLKRIERYVKGSPFLATYGDGLSDIDLRALFEMHIANGSLATMTCVTPRTHYGIVSMDERGRIIAYDEKPQLKTWVNGGFFVFSTEIFSYLGENDTLEHDPFERLIRDGKLQAYSHHGFWMCMDTYKDNLALNDLWDSGNPPWKVWED